MIKNFLIWIIKRYQLQQVVEALQIEDNIKACNKRVTNNGGTFLAGASVENQQNDPGKIVIGKGTNVAGLLLIFKYGGKILIGDNCYIGDHSRIWSGENVIIGNDVLISHNVNIIDTSAHEFDSGERAYRYKDLLKNGPWSEKGSVITAPVIIEDNSWISFNVTILKGVKIGKGAIIGANSVVTREVPPYSLVVGNPGRVVRYLK
ncbi:acyltransferase [Ferruginibacter paludis]|uniref:acyltransferase n=1 Tax=Ferruginibacter paludis TaxID=1310417 RepID=UPI0025B46890|nr:acyltransferase [Ferruginibacter paludis]MDN3655873.1 acyltransferase [Ferruginibacter paludis]